MCREGQDRLQFYSVAQESLHEQSHIHVVLLSSHVCGQPEAGFICPLAVVVAVGSTAGLDGDMVMAAIAPCILESHGDL